MEMLDNKSNKTHISHYDLNNTLFEKSVFFAFQNDKSGKAAADKISKALIEIKRDRTFNSIIESTHPE